jgi:NADPH-dependent 2,4-dienoyl-CoA reductase/sulfur reductase-like enzyme
VAEARSADVAVVGAGPAGLAAGCRAAEYGARVIVLDEAPGPGGQIWRTGPRADPPVAARAWLARFARSGAELLSSAAVADIEEDRTLLAEVDGTPLRVRASRLVLATGARERFLPFPGWTLPGVTGVGAAQALLKAGASLAGRRMVVAGTGPLLLPVAASLARAGARVSHVAEQAPASALARFLPALWRRPGKIAEAASYAWAFREADWRAGTWVASAQGRDTVQAVVLTDGRTERAVPCDVLACAYGLVPNLELARRLGCRLEEGVVAVDGRQETSVNGVFCAGEPTGVGGVDLALAEGEVAGLAAAGAAAGADLLARRQRHRAFARALDRTFGLRPELRRLPAPDTVVCRCEDVPLSRLDASWTPRQAKLYTRVGMGACQGRVCGSALEFLYLWSADTVRPPVKAARVGTLEAEP